MSEAKVTELTISIAVVGLLNALVITRSHLLVAGWHRLVACQRLGWKSVPVVIVEEHQLVNELQEMDENLVRSPLNLLQRCEHRRRGKEIFERLSKQVKEGFTTERNYFAGFNSYTEFAASQSEITRRTIQQEISLAERLCEEAKALTRDLPFANRKVDLTLLSRMTHKEQVRTAKIIQAGAETLDDAIALLASKGLPSGGHRLIKSREAKGLTKLLEFASQGLKLEDFPDEEEIDFIFKGFNEFNVHIVRTLNSVVSRLKNTRGTKRPQQRHAAEKHVMTDAPLLQIIEATEQPA